MEQQEQLLLEPLLDKSKTTRRSLLPMWMKIFIWIFMITGVMAPFCFFAAMAGSNLQVAMYGLESHDPLSFAGMLILLLFLFKGIVAYGLWTGKDWAIYLGIADAIIGISICSYIMIAPYINSQAGFAINVRLELLALIPYLIKLRKIKAQWHPSQLT